MRTKNTPKKLSRGARRLKPSYRFPKKNPVPVSTTISTDGAFSVSISVNKEFFRANKDLFRCAIDEPEVIDLTNSDGEEYYPDLFMDDASDLTPSNSETGPCNGEIVI